MRAIKCDCNEIKTLIKASGGMCDFTDQLRALLPLVKFKFGEPIVYRLDKIPVED